MKAWGRILVMPITKNAIKKLRADKKKAAYNRPVKAKVKSAVKQVKENPSAENVKQLYSALDRAVKNKQIPQNRAARIKSRLVKAAKVGKKDNPFVGKKKASKTSKSK